MSDDELEEATDQEKRSIAKHFIMHSPNGEVNDVVKDMKLLIGEGLIDDTYVKDTMGKYARAQYVVCGDGDEKVIASKYSDCGNDSGPNVYLNPNSKKMVTIDPKSHKVVSSDDVKVDETHEDLRAAVQKAMDGYLNTSFQTEKGTCQVFSANGKLDIVISMKNLNIANFWSGGWRSEYSVGCDQGEQKLTGRIRINVHYFEEGNVQLNSDYNMDDGNVVNVTGDLEATAKKIASIISQLETDFHTGLEQFYVNMHDETFKAMRRVLPKTAKTMEWRAAVHKIIGEMGEQIS